MLGTIDALQRKVDLQPAAYDALDEHYKAALNMITAKETQQAFQIEKESDKTRDGYGRTPNAGQLQRTLDAQAILQRVPNVADRQPADLLLMRFATDPQHLAIFAGNTIIHAHEASGKCVEHVLSPVWASRIVAVYRFRGVA